MAGIEVGVATTGAQVVLSSVINPLVAKLYQNVEAKLQNRDAARLQEEIRELARQLDRLKGWLQDAEEKQAKNDAVRGWLADLEDVAYDMEDLIDDYAVDAATRNPRRKVRQLFSLFHCVNTSVQKYRERSADILKRLEILKNEPTKFGLQSSNDSALIPIVREQTTSTLLDDEDSVKGRSELKDRIVNKLLSLDEGSGSSSDGNRSFFVLPIIGMGGIGKTTLAQLVYNDKNIQKHFEPRSWICVSNDLNDDRIQKEFIESAVKSERDRNELSNISNLSERQARLRKYMEGKRYFLVLDDAWNEERSSWDSLLRGLNVGATGSVIVVTTRSRKVVDSITDHLEPITLEGLSHDETWEVLKRYAFGASNASNMLDYPRYELIGKQISEKLQGSPLAAKSIGCLLRTQPNIDRWMEVLRNDLLDNIKDDVLPILALSYKHLHSVSKQCFCFCSLFPEDFKFDKQDIVDLWLCEGFIQVDNILRIEEFGLICFDDLERRLFFQHLRNNYVVHDIIHQLCQKISSEVYNWIHDGKFRYHYERTRHISYYHDELDEKILKKICKFERLRTLLIMGTRYIKVEVTKDIIDGWFTRLKYLRVLKLNSCKIRKLPKSIGNLKHLRYLDISHNYIEKVPTNIGSCSKLEILNLEGNDINELPNVITRLVHLKRLVAKSNCVSSLNGIGSLTALLSLEEFEVRKTQGHTINELKYLNLLGGTLKIKGLTNVQSQKEAMYVELHKKERLRHLELEWESSETSSSDTIDEKVLEKLRPHDNIRELVIVGNQGSKPPSWISNERMPLLETICLSGCSKWKALPPLMAFGGLISITLEGLESFKKIPYHLCCSSNGIAFPCLEELVLKDNINLEEWEEMGEGQHGCFPKLHHLKVKGCPMLRNIPSLVAKFKEVYIVGELFYYENDELKQVSCLKIFACRQIIPSMLLLQRGVSSSLEKLVISQFYGHDESFTGSCISSLTRLQSLILKNCPNIPYIAELDVQSPNCVMNGESSYDEVCEENNQQQWMEAQHLHEVGSTSVSNSNTCCGEEKGAQRGCFTFLKELIVENSPNSLPSLLHSIATSKNGCAINMDGNINDPMLGCMGSSNDGKDKWPQPIMALARLEIRKDQINDPALYYLLESNLSTLEHLIIFQCDNIRSLPMQLLSRFSKLNKLVIEWCEQLASIGLGGLSALDKLVICRCPQLVVWPAVTQSLPQTAKVRELNVYGCSVQLLTDVLVQCTVTQRLEIRNMAGLTCFDGDLEEALLRQTSLRELGVSYCTRLLCLPAEIGRLSSLRELSIVDCPEMQHLPSDLLSSLRRLRISVCPKLEERYSRDKGGPDWDQISHIPSVTFP